MQSEKDKQRKEYVQILCSILENCNKDYYYFPIKALSEFYAEKSDERSLGKRLAAENLLCYKNIKEWRGRSYLLTDFKKKQTVNLDTI